MWHQNSDTLQLQVGITLVGDNLTTLTAMLRSVVTDALVKQTHFQNVAGTSRIRIALGSASKEELASDHASLLLDTKQTARLLGVSDRTVFGMQAERKMPAPVRLGKCVRWRYAEVKAWTEAGCPSLEEWTWVPEGRIEGPDH